MEAGREDLAEQVDGVASGLGDGLGYDIVSFHENGAERLLGVKTTNAGILTPFFITPNELALSEHKGDTSRLYRVFDFSTNPHVYVLSGPLRDKLALKPQVYAAVPTNSRED